MLLTLGNTPIDFGNMDQYIANTIESLIKKKGNISKQFYESKEFRELHSEITSVLNRGIDTGFEAAKQIASTGMTTALHNDVSIFAGWKTYHAVNEAGLHMFGKDGKIVDFNTFRKEAGEVFKAAKLNLRAEYNFTAQSAEMAAKWEEFEADGDRYDLQYRTAGDSKVRPEHAALAGVTLPASDPFWNSYYPPNGYNCRCTVVQVRHGKHKSTLTSAEAIAAGEKMTADPKKALFRFNSGKNKKVFPRQHPYYPKGCGDCNLFEINLFTPDKKVCEFCAINRQCVLNNSKSKRAIERTHYLFEMEPLLEAKLKKDNKGNFIYVGFSRKGNKHLLSDSYGRSSVLRKDDLASLDKVLDSATYVNEVSLSKERKDGIQHFYYYKAQIRGKTVYLNVAEIATARKGKGIIRERFLYSITDRIK